MKDNIYGSLQVLKNWCSRPIDASASDDDEVRCEVLLLAYRRLTSYAVRGPHVVIKVVNELFSPHSGKSGRILLESVVTADGCKVVVVDYVPDGEHGHIRFWMNASSMADLGNSLRAKSHLRDDSQFDSIFLGADEDVSTYHDPADDQACYEADRLNEAILSGDYDEQRSFEHDHDARPATSA